MKIMKNYNTFIVENKLNDKLPDVVDLILNKNEIYDYFLENYVFSVHYVDLSFDDVEDYLDSSFDEYMEEFFVNKSNLSMFDSSDKREYIEDNYLENVVEEFWIDNYDIDDIDDYETKLDYLEDFYDDIIIESNNEIIFYEYMYSKQYYNGIEYFDDSGLSVDDIDDYIDYDDVNEHILMKKISYDKKRDFYLDNVLDDEKEIKKIINYEHKNILYFYDDVYDYNLFDETKYQQILINEYIKYIKNTPLEYLLSDMTSNGIVLSDEIKKKYSKYLKMNKFNL